MQVLIIVRVILLLPQVPLPHFHVVIMYDHALKMKLSHVDKLVKCVLTVRREYETSPVELEQFPNGCTQIFPKVVEEQAVCADDEVKAVL